MSGWLLVHPTDVVKVRLQLEGQKPAAQRFASVAELVRGLVRAEGLAGLYSGLSAALAAPADVHDDAARAVRRREGEDRGRHARADRRPGRSRPCSGGVASFLACPVEVSLCRMQADGALPAAQRAATRTSATRSRRSRARRARRSLRGAAPTVARAAVVSVSQLVSYDQAKQWLGPTGVGGLREGVGLHLAARRSSRASRLVRAAAARHGQDAHADAGRRDARTGALPYASLAGTLGTIARREGAASLWRGFGPYFLRGGGHTVFMLLFKEQFTAAARRYQASHEGEAYYTYTP